MRRGYPKVCLARSAQSMAGWAELAWLGMVGFGRLGLAGLAWLGLACLVGFADRSEGGGRVARVGRPGGSAGMQKIGKRLYI